MKNLDVFPVQEVSQRTQDFLEDAAQGKLVLLTHQEQPTFLAVPFKRTTIRVRA